MLPYSTANGAHTAQGMSVLPALTASRMESTGCANRPCRQVSKSDISLIVNALTTGDKQSPEHENTFSQFWASVSRQPSSPVTLCFELSNLEAILTSLYPTRVHLCHGDCSAAKRRNVLKRHPRCARDDGTGLLAQQLPLLFAHLIILFAALVILMAAVCSLDHSFRCPCNSFLCPYHSCRRPSFLN